jgi:hypothetical protein
MSRGKSLLLGGQGGTFAVRRTLPRNSFDGVVYTDGKTPSCSALTWPGPGPPARCVGVSCKDRSILLLAKRTGAH